MPIPWDQVILHGPRVLDAATAMFDKWKTRPKPEAVDPDAEVTIQLAAIVKRQQTLKETKSTQAEVSKNMAEQIQGLSAGLAEISGGAARAAGRAGSPRL